MKEPVQLRRRVLALWILFFSFIAYALLTVLLVYQRGRTLQLTLIFGDAPSDILAIALVVYYFALDPGLTWYFYRRALVASADKSHVPALASVVVGASAPYLYGLLLSFVGIMRGVFPILYIGFFYIVGVVVGLRIISPLVAHIESK
jgi:hypothetical protein